jgi:hypothetical protein
VEDRRGSRVGTVGERKLGEEDLCADDDSREIRHLNSDGDAGEIRDQGGPDA